MEPEGSVPHSQVPTTCPCPEPARSSPYPTSHFLRPILYDSRLISGTQRFLLYQTLNAASLDMNVDTNVDTISLTYGWSP